MANGDVRSIRLADARTPHPDEDDEDERQFLVGKDDGFDPYEVEHRGSSLDQEQVSSRTLMLHPQASVSLVDVNAMNGPEDADVAGDPGMGLSAKAGAILVRFLLSLFPRFSCGWVCIIYQGIHNIFVVAPQFLVTGFSSIIFAIFDPDKSALHGHLGSTKPVVNGTIPIPVTLVTNGTTGLILAEEPDITREGPNSIAIVFR